MAHGLMFSSTKNRVFRSCLHSLISAGVDWISHTLTISISPLDLAISSPRPIEKVVASLLLRVAPIFNLVPFDTRIIRVGEALCDDPFEIVRAHQVKELAAPALDR